MLVDGVKNNGPRNPAAGVDQIAELTRQVANLREAVVSRQRIGVAIGLLAERGECDVDRAWELLIWLSQTLNVKVRRVAQVLVDTHCRRLPEGDVELAAELLRRLPNPRSATVDRGAAVGGDH